MVGIPSPNFDTHRVTEILRRLKRGEIKTKNNVAYRRVYIKGKLNSLNTVANAELGVGAYTIKHFRDDWYYVGLREVSIKSWHSSSVEALPVYELLNKRWSDEQRETGSSDCVPA